MSTPPDGGTPAAGGRVCRRCGRPVEPGAQVCPDCGAGLLATSASGSAGRGCGLAFVGGLLGIAAGTGLGVLFIIGIDCGNAVGRTVPHGALFAFAIVAVLVALAVAVVTVGRHPLIGSALIVAALVFIFPFASCVALLAGATGGGACTSATPAAPAPRESYRALRALHRVPRSEPAPANGRTNTGLN